MITMQSGKYFDEMKNSTFSFQALTRVWFALAGSVPDKLHKKLDQVQRYVMDPSNRAAIELVLTGAVKVYRGMPAENPHTGKRYIPMYLVEMEEYGYSKELDTTLKMSGRADRASFGYTHQLGHHLDAPAEVRITLNLQIDFIHGQMSQVAASTCTTKSVKAVTSAFPFPPGTVFRHVGKEAAPVIVPGDGSVVGYLGYGVMMPLHPLGVAKRGRPRGLAEAVLSARENDFVLGKIDEP
jgi:hypothetical protein